MRVSLKKFAVSSLDKNLRDFDWYYNYTAGLSSRSISSNERPLVSTTLLLTYSTAAAHTTEKPKYTVLTPNLWTTLKNISPIKKLDICNSQPTTSEVCNVDETFSECK